MIKESGSVEVWKCGGVMIYKNEFKINIGKKDGLENEN
jgi:hypothetical protein